jgi:hypothetical protein
MWISLVVGFNRSSDVRGLPAETSQFLTLFQFEAGFPVKNDFIRQNTENA